MIGKQLTLRVLLTGALIAVAFAQAPPNSASGGATSPGNRVVLKVGTAQVTQEEFESSIGDIEPKGGEGEGAIEKTRRQRGEDYASVLMLSQLAVADHLDLSPDISRQLEVARLQVLSDAEFASLLRQAEPTPEEISQYYSAHQSDFDVVRLHRLFIWKVGGDSKNSHGLNPQDARSRADKILQTSAAGGDAQKLVDEFKNSQNGLLDAAPVMFTRGELSPRMEKVAFGIKEGEWAEVDDTPDSILLIQLVKHSHRQIGEVSSLIATQLKGQKMQSRMDDLRKKAAIWMDGEYFGNASAPASAAKMPTSARPTLQEQPTTRQEKKDDER